MPPHPPLVTRRGGFALPAYLDFIVPEDRGEPALSCRPIASGLLITPRSSEPLGGGLLFAPTLARRFLRRKRGRCRTCGYDLLADLAGGCPECGWRRAASPAAIPSRPPR